MLKNPDREPRLAPSRHMGATVGDRGPSTRSIISLLFVFDLSPVICIQRKCHLTVVTDYPSNRRTSAAFVQWERWKRACEAWVEALSRNHP